VTNEEVATLMLLGLGGLLLSMVGWGCLALIGYQTSVQWGS
jgi:hypothetical protein